MTALPEYVAIAALEGDSQLPEIFVGLVNFQ